MDRHGRGGRAVKDVLKIVLAIIIIVIAWKILKGLIGLLVGVAVAGLVIYGVVKLVDGGQKRIK
jgi:predicted PurR-regulated permease PerM